MKVLAIKLTTDIDSIKVVYEKNGRTYVRSGVDGFTVGQPLGAPVRSLGKRGFSVVEPNPVFKNAEELIDNLDRFHMKSNGTVTYSV